MTHLVLAVLLQVVNALLMKHGEQRGQERLLVMTVNYIVASTLGLALWRLGGGGVPGITATWVAAAAGFFYAASLLAWMGAIRTAGLALSTAVMRLSVIWPAALSVVVYAEVPTPLQALGVILALCVLGLLASGALGRRHAGLSETGLGALLLVWVLTGGVGGAQKVFNELGSPDAKLAWLALAFGFSALLCAGALLAGRLLRPGPRPSAADALRGAAFGVSNIGASYFTLRGLEAVLGVVAFPFLNSGVIVGATVAGLLIWRERPGWLGLAAIALAGAAIVLMNLG